MADQASLRELGPSPEGPLAGEHNPNRSPLHRNPIVYPKSSRELRCVSRHHAMNSGFTEIHRFAMLTRRKQRSKRA